MSSQSSLGAYIRKFREENPEAYAAASKDINAYSNFIQNELKKAKVSYDSKALDKWVARNRLSFENDTADFVQTISIWLDVNLFDPLLDAKVIISTLLMQQWPTITSILELARSCGKEYRKASSKDVILPAHGRRAALHQS